MKSLQTQVKTQSTQIKEQGEEISRYQQELSRYQWQDPALRRVINVRCVIIKEQEGEIAKQKEEIEYLEGMLREYQVEDRREEEVGDIEEDFEWGDDSGIGSSARVEWVDSSVVDSSMVDG